MNPIRLAIKKNFPKGYDTIRSCVFPLYLSLTKKRRQSFTERQVKRVSYAGEQFSIVIDPSNGFVDTEIFASGVYEPDILSTIKKYLAPGATFVDIGSNIGQHALFAASVVGPSGTVVAFEPIPKLVTQLQESCAQNNFASRLTIKALACSDTTGNLHIKLKPGNIGGSSLHHENATFPEITIPTDQADNHLTQLAKVSVIKIDTEGHEIEALRGLTKTLEKHRPTLIIEYSPSLRNDSAHYAEAFFTILNNHRYRYYDLEDGDRAILDTDQFRATFTKLQTNLLCLPQP